MNKPFFALLMLVCVSLACAQGGTSPREGNLPVHCTVHFNNGRGDESFGAYTTLIKDGALTFFLERPSAFGPNSVKVFNMSEVAGHECIERGAK